MGILGGLDMWGVSRLKYSISRKHEAILTQLRKIMNPMHNWLNYRSMLKRVTGPVLPYLGVFLRDITYIEDGNPDYIDDEQGIINFEKIMLLGEMLKQIEMFQKQDFNKLPVNTTLQDFMTHLHVPTEQEVERKSFQIEPPTPNVESENEESEFSYISEYSESMMSEESACSFFSEEEQEKEAQDGHYYVWRKA